MARRKRLAILVGGRFAYASFLPKIWKDYSNPPCYRSCRIKNAGETIMRRLIASPLRHGVVAAAFVALTAGLAPAGPARAFDCPVAQPQAKAGILKETYTPNLPADEYAVLHRRFAARVPLAEMRDGRFDYVLLASAPYVRFLEPEELAQAHQREMAERYDEIFRSFQLVREWTPSATRMGPALRLYRVPDPAVCSRRCETCSSVRRASTRCSG